MLCDKTHGPVLGSLLWQSYKEVLQKQGAQIHFKAKINYFSILCIWFPEQREHFQISMKWE